MAISTRNQNRQACLRVPRQGAHGEAEEWITPTTCPSLRGKSSQKYVPKILVKEEQQAPDLAFYQLGSGLGKKNMKP